MAGIAAFNGRYNVAPFNTLPACAIPVGLSSEGLPIGAEVLGAPSSDRRTLEIAKVLEGVIGHIAPPVLK
jgi:Asp-tRNA(Asn)/Glu-tRNA(Gln) amidotransferase A subunit family amidase